MPAATLREKLSPSPDQVRALPGCARSDRGKKGGDLSQGCLDAAWSVRGSAKLHLEPVWMVCPVFHQSSKQKALLATPGCGREGPREASPALSSSLIWGGPGVWPPCSLTQAQRVPRTGWNGTYTGRPVQMRVLLGDSGSDISSPTQRIVQTRGKALFQPQALKSIWNAFPEGRSSFEHKHKVVIRSERIRCLPYFRNCLIVNSVNENEHSG